MIKKVVLALFGIGALISGCVPTYYHPSYQTIQRIAQETGLQRSWLGLYLTDSKGHTIISLNKEKFFIPASNLKIITTAVALDVLGTSFRWNTLVLLDTLGKLHFVTSGDPTLTFNDLLYLTRITTAKLTLDTIDTLVFDLFALDSIYFGPGWMWDDTPFTYSAPISPLNIEHNTLRVLIFPQTNKIVTFPEVTSLNLMFLNLPFPYFIPPDTIFLPSDFLDKNTVQQFNVVIRKPERFAAQLFVNLLRSQGLEVKNVTYNWDTPLIGRFDTLAVKSSMTLREIVFRLLKESDNLFAEVIFKTLGKEIYGPPGTWFKGMMVVDSVVNSWGLDTSQIKLVDGSGLSRYNQVTPQFLVSLLKVAKTKPWFADFLVSLPVSGEDGTLRSLSFDFKGYIRAKTGTMSGVRNICGYILTQKNNWLLFSFMTNGYKGSRKKVDIFYTRVLKMLIKGTNIFKDALKSK